MLIQWALYFYFLILIVFCFVLCAENRRKIKELTRCQLASSLELPTIHHLKEFSGDREFTTELLELGYVTEPDLYQLIRYQHGCELKLADTPSKC